MRFFKNLYLGFRSYSDAGRFIRDHKLWLYFTWPLILACLLFWLKYSLDAQISSSQLSVNELGAEVTLDNMLILLKIALNFLITEYSKYIVIICISPVLVHASAKAERILTGNKYAFQFKQFITDIKRAVRIAFRNLLVQSIMIGVWYILVLIFSGLEPYSKAVVLLIGFYFYGFSMMDYSMERQRFSITESIKWVRKNRGLAVSLGSVFSLFFFVDIYHFPIGAIFAPVLGVIAATLALHKKLDFSKSEFAKKTVTKESKKPV